MLIVVVSMLQNMLDWFKDEENGFFVMHVAAVFVLALAVEYFARIYTTFSYPTIIFLAAASFMWNYPTSAIKGHGLFSQFLIELRLLWLVILGAVFEYAAFGLFENHVNRLLALAAFVLGLVVLFASHARLHENIVKERGFQ